MMNFLSYNPMSYKLSLVKTLVHRVFYICNSWHSFHKDISELKHILTRNRFPPKLIDFEIKRYLDTKFVQQNVQQNAEENSRKVSFYKLPYIQDTSERAKKQLKHIQRTFCKDIDINISFSTFKIGSVFSAKDKLNKALKSCVVYRYICPGCNARYVGETTRHFATRTREHLYDDKSSHIFKHLNTSPGCRSLNDNTCFEIIDSARSEFSLKLKEAMYINWERPSLNKQQKHVTVSISV